MIAKPLPQLCQELITNKYTWDLMMQKDAANNALRCRGTVVKNGEPVDILVVEDNESQLASIVAALQNAIPDVLVLPVRDGPEALDFLFSRGAWADRVGAPPPKLILLDLALPEADGFSVLGQIRALEPKDALTLTPIVIFTDSQASVDITQSYRCGANSYIIKPLSFPDFKAIVETVGQYWITHNQTSS
jgi:two-component system, response regulator